MGCKQSKDAEDSVAARRSRDLQRALEQVCLRFVLCDRVWRVDMCRELRVSWMRGRVIGCSVFGLLFCDNIFCHGIFHRIECVEIKGVCPLLFLSTIFFRTNSSTVCRYNAHRGKAQENRALNEERLYFLQKSCNVRGYLDAHPKVNDCHACGKRISKSVCTLLCCASSCKAESCASRRLAQALHVKRGGCRAAFCVISRKSSLSFF